MSSSDSGLPAGYSPPNAIISDTDKSGWIIIVTALGLCCVLLCLAIRIYVRVSVSPPFKWDDNVLAAATVVTLIQSALVFAQVSHGQGKSIELISKSDLVELQKSAYVSDLLYIIILAMSQACIALLFLRLTPAKIHNKISFGVLASSVVWAVCGIFMTALRCDLSHPWISYNAGCKNIFLRWQILAAVNIILECVIFFLSIYLVAALQMSFKQKAKVVLAFSFRVPVIAAAALRLYYIKDGLLTNNPTLLGVMAIIWTQVELNYSITMATVPCLKPFMSALSTNYGDISRIENIGSQYGSGKDSNVSYGLGSVAHAASRRKSTIAGMKLSDSQFRKDGVYNITKVTHSSQPAGDGISIESNESTKMIIKKEVNWTVERDVGSKGSDGVPIVLPSVMPKKSMDRVRPRTGTDNNV